MTLKPIKLFRNELKRRDSGPSLLHTILNFLYVKPSYCGYRCLRKQHTCTKLQMVVRRRLLWYGKPPRPPKSKQLDLLERILHWDRKTSSEHVFGCVRIVYSFTHHCTHWDLWEKVLIMITIWVQIWSVTLTCLVYFTPTHGLKISHSKMPCLVLPLLLSLSARRALPSKHSLPSLTWNYPQTAPLLFL